MLNELLKKINNLGILVKPYEVEEKELKKHNYQCILYKYRPVSNISFKLEIRIIAKTLEKALEIEHMLTYELVGVGDTVKVPKCTSIEFGEGYSAKEKETKTIHLFFNINVTGYK